MAKRSRGLSFYKRRKKISSVMIREVFSWIFGILAAIFVAAVLDFFFGMTTNVVGVSMEPTLYNGQQIFIDRFFYVLSSPKRGDVVVFLPNGNENSHYYVKRVVAVPGDRLVIQDGTLFVNGIESEWVSAYISDPGIAGNEFTLENGEYFCVGDNPGNSEDSRSANIGPVEDTDIIGKAWFLSRSSFSLQASRTSPSMARIPAPLLELTSSAYAPCSSKKAIHSLLQTGSARSALFRSTILALFRASSPISGLRLLAGILASTSSITKSVSFIFSCIIRLAFVI